MAWNDLTPEEQAAALGQNQKSGDGSGQYGQLTPEELVQLEKEKVLADEFGNPIAAGALAGARGLSLGLSDIALTESGAMTPEQLKEYKRQSPTISAASEVAGTIAPLVVGGLGAAPAALAMKGAEKVGALAGKKFASETAKKIVGNAVQGAAEGAAFSVGQLASEVAMQNQKLSAESIVGTVGPGILVGGTLGGLIGLGSAAVPKVSSLVSPVSKRVKEAASDFVSPVKAAEEISGLTPTKLAKLNAGQEAGKSFSDDLAEYTSRNLVKSTLPSSGEIHAANEAALKRAGKEINEYTKLLDQEVRANPEILDQTKPFERIQKVFDDYKVELEKSKHTNYPQIRKLRQMEKDFEAVKSEVINSQISDMAAAQGLGSRAEVGAFDALNEYRKRVSAIKYNKVGTALENFPAQVAESLRQEIRKITDETADLVSAKVGGHTEELARALKSANKDYHIGKTIAPSLAKQVYASGKNGKLLKALINAPDLALEAKRNLAVMGNVGAKVSGVKNTITGAVRTFFEKTKRPTRVMSTKFLVNSGFALTDSGVQPKDRKQAFKNVQSHIASLQDPDLMTTKLAKNIGPLMKIAPTMGFEAQQQLARAVTFLNAKLPKHMGSGSAQLLFPKEYEPTTMEQAKFERYLQAVEQPLTVMAELEQGTITREHVEALKFVYPEIYGAVQQEVMKQIADNPEIPYQKRLQLGILLDIPADESLTGEAIMGLQNTFQAQQSPGPSQSQPVNGNVQAVQEGNLDEINVGSRVGTNVEDLARRRG